MANKKKSNNNYSWHSQRFNQSIAQQTLQYTASINFDKRLALFDIEASIAHANMLFAKKIITKIDLDLIKGALIEIKDEIIEAKFNWRIEDEDVHMNIERRLIEKIGDSGRKLHTARSRNDQVATDVRLYLRYEIDEITIQLIQLHITIIRTAEKNINTIMPGYTHMQIAQPITFAHYLMAYFEMFYRDHQRLVDIRKRVNVLPLGAAALAGSSFNIDRKMIMKELNFSNLSENSLDAVSDRDFIIEFLSAIAITSMHISRLAEELILWMNPQFGYISLPDKFCTTSSIMPQKKNPDILELARAKTGRIYGNLLALLTIMKSQPLAYNSDNQEDKESLFDSIDTIKNTLSIITKIIKEVTPNKQKMLAALKFGHAGATDLADFLVTKGIAFRKAHGMVAQAVNFSEKIGKDLSNLTSQELKKAIPDLKKDLATAIEKIKIENVVNARNNIGGTSPNQVKHAIARAKKRIANK